MLMVVGIDRIPGQHSCHFWAFQEVLWGKTTKLVANGSVVAKLQTLEVRDFLKKSMDSNNNPKGNHHLVLHQQFLRSEPGPQKKCHDFFVQFFSPIQKQPNLTIFYFLQQHIISNIPKSLFLMFLSFTSVLWWFWMRGTQKWCPKQWC